MCPPRADYLLKLLSQKYGKVWKVVRNRQIEVDDHLTKHLCNRMRIKAIVLPLDKIILFKRIALIIKHFCYSLEKYLNFLEPSDLRELEKKIPQPRNKVFYDLKEKILTYISSDARWYKAENVNAIREFVQCLRLSCKEFSDLCIKRGIAYSFLGLIKNYSDITKALRKYRANELGYTCLYGADGTITLGLIVKPKRVNIALEIMEEFCFKTLSNKELYRLSWLIYGYVPKGYEEVKKIWEKLRNMSGD